MSVPEKNGPAEMFYQEEESYKYSNNSRIIKIQKEMSLRCLELLSLPAEKKCLLLDLGCGSGISKDVLEKEGHCCAGIDISKEMLSIAKGSFPVPGRPWRRPFLPSRSI